MDLMANLNNTVLDNP